MIELFPFAGYPVAVLGLGREGMANAKALSLSGAEVIAWDDDEAKRTAADAAKIPVQTLDTVDWREMVSLVIEHDIPHGETGAHAIVDAARAGGCEVIVDSELLARAQRDAAYIAVVSRNHAGRALDMLEHVLSLTGREAEVGGDDARPLLELYALDLGGVYGLAMPPGRAELTVSITFDAALYLDLGNEPWPPCRDWEETVQASRWVFHRQTGPKGAIVSVDSKLGRQAHDDLAAKAEQIVIPISGTSRVPGGVYVAGNVLYDDMKGEAVAVTELPSRSAGDGLLAAGVYAVARVLDIPPAAAMASLRSFFIE